MPRDPQDIHKRPAEQKIKSQEEEQEEAILLPLGALDAPPDAEVECSPMKKLCAGMQSTAIADKKPDDAAAAIIAE